MIYNIYSWSEIRHIAFEVLHGLSFLNAHGIVHRNLSLRNICLTPKVKQNVPLLSGFLSVGYTVLSVGK